MKSKLVLGILLTLLFIGVLMLAFRIQPVKAWTGGTITIEQLGGVSPEGAPISSSDNITYTLDDDIVCTEGIGIWVERDNIILDGAGHTLQGTGSGTGIDMVGRTNVTIKDMEIKDCGWFGIQVNNSSDVTISGNNITNNGFYGVMVVNFSRHNTITGNNISANLNCSIGIYYESEHNRVSDNNITNNVWGVSITRSANNVVSGNYIADSHVAVSLTSSSCNKFYHNTFINSTSRHVYLSINYTTTPANYWDDGYPSGGNYWSNYTGDDEKRGLNQTWPGSDGIGDTPHVIDDHNQDNYPLMNPWTPMRTSVTWKGQDRPVTIVSNTTISDMDIDTTGQSVTLSFTSSGQPGEKGYILVIFPMVNNSQPTVFLNGTEITPPQLLVNNNGTHYFIYFEFTFSSSYTIVVQFALPVGGIWVPVDKFSILAPYIALTLTIILAVSISVAYIKIRKKQ